MDADRKINNSYEEPPSRFGLLNSIGAVFEQRKEERKRKRQADKVKEDVAKAHSLYLQENVVCRYEYGRAGEAVSQWVKENGGWYCNYIEETSCAAPLIKSKFQEKLGAVAEKARKQLERREQEENFLSSAVISGSGKRKRASKTTSSPRESLNPHSYKNRQFFVSESNKKHRSGNPHSACTSLLDSSSEMFTVNHTGTDKIDLDSSEEVIDLTSNRFTPTLNYAGNNTDSPYMCVVMNCGIIFDSVETCFAHNSTFSHNSCNPFKHLVNSTLPEHPLMYNCPKCDESFQRRIECQEHMIFNDHLPIVSPIPICGYMCPQCLLIFKNLIHCHTHMTDLNHHRLSYAFPSDVPGKSACSIPVSRYMAQEFHKKCIASSYEVKCVQCKVVLKSGKEKEIHRLHSLVSQSSFTPEEVFAEFLTDKACNECGKIVWEDNGDKEFHACDDHNIGWLVDHGCRTLKEYIIRCSILPNCQDDGASVVTVSDIESVFPLHNPSSCLSWQHLYSALATISDKNMNANTVKCKADEKIKFPEQFDCDILFISTSKSNVLNRNVEMVKSALKITAFYKPEAHVEGAKDSSESTEHAVGDEFHDALESNSSSLDSFLSCSSLLDSCHNIVASQLKTDTSRKRKRESSTEGIQDTEPSVSTWIMNSRNQKVEQFPDYNNPFQSGPVTRSSNKTSPSKRYLRLSVDNLPTPPFDKRENFESNNSAHSVNDSKEDSEEFMELGSPGKLTKKDRKRLQRKLKKALIQENIISPPTNNVSTSFTEPTTSSTPAPMNSSDNKPETTNYLNPDIEILSCSAGFHTNLPSESYPSDEQTGDSIPAHKLRVSPTKLSKSAKKKTKNCEAKQEQLISKPCTSINAVCDSEGDISTSNLSKMHLLIFLDLDNWPGFFKKLPRCLPDKTFVWTFYGGHTVWRPPKSIAFIKLNKSKCFHLHSQCGKTKDAADFAICFTIGKMDDRLPQTVPFAILSGDRGFCEIERQMKNTSRRTVVIDPHEAHKHSNDMIYTMILSVVQP